MHIKFGTDGWRAIIAKEYTVENVKRVTEGTARWMKKNGMEKVVIGHDCRFGGTLFAEAAACVFGAHGIKVHLAKDFVSTPMVSLGVLKTKSDVGVVITASHNPPSYNGYKLKSGFGGPMIPKYIAEVEAMVPETCTDGLPGMEDLFEEGLLNYIDLEDIYLDHVEKHFDLEAIRNSPFRLAYDAMYGAGQKIMKRILPNAVFLHCEENPSFMGQAPEPIHRNLGELSSLIREDDSISVGLANDGDADRIGMYDEDGNFVDSHHLLLLLLWYMREYKKQEGKVIVSFSVTNKLRDMAEKFGLEFRYTPIGFKYIAEIMLDEDVIVGGEESGGLTVKGHIPERDGIWIGLIILEYMAKSGKSLKTLVNEIHNLVGSFYYDRYDLHIPETKKQEIVEMCKNEPFSSFGEYKVTAIDDLDGFKFLLQENEWLMIRPSGTEPLLRVYAQGNSRERLYDILESAKKTVLS